MVQIKLWWLVGPAPQMPDNRARAIIADGPPHTTGHAGPHPAVQRRWASDAQRVLRLSSPCSASHALVMPTPLAMARFRLNTVPGARGPCDCEHDGVGPRVGSAFATPFRHAPLLPIAHPKPTTKPLVQPVEQFQLRGQTEVTRPSAHIASQ